MTNLLPSRRYQSGFSLVLFLLILGLCLILLLSGFFWIHSYVYDEQTAQQPGASLQPSMPVTDYAPDLPENQKTAIVIRNADSSERKFLVNTAAISDFVKRLPPGETVISETPLGK